MPVRWRIRMALARLPWGYWSGYGTACGHCGPMGKPGGRPETLRERVRRVVHNASRVC